MIDKGIFDLTGKVVLVTGGSRGLGKCFTEAAAAFGAKVAISARDKGKIDETLDALGNNVETLGIPADMTKEEDILRMIDETLKKFGRIDVLFNNAGTTRPMRQIHEEIVDDFDFIINANLRSPFLVLKHVLPVMMKQNYGVVVNISSTAGLRAEDPEIAPVGYSAAKAGINVMTQIAAIEYAKYNIRVNAIAPGIHHSDLNRGHGPEKPPTPEEIAAKEARQQRIIADFPMSRFGNAEEMAGLALLLASDASSYITGQIFTEDGGRSAKH